jgi:hypothetical protein
MLKSKLPMGGFVLVVLLLAITVAVPLWLSWTGALQTEEARRRNANLPLLVVIVGAALFLLAHLVLFRLGDPNRYAAAPLRVVTPMGLGIAAALALALAVGWAGRSPKDEAGARRRLVLAGAAAGLGGLVLALAVTEPNPHFVRGRYPGLYAFLERQPKNALVASLSREADNLPSLARRPVLTSWEYILPYNLGYVRPMRARTEDLIRALYGGRIEPMRALIEEYGIDLVLLEKDAFTVGRVSSAWWRRLYPEDAEAALATLRDGRPAVSERVERCMLYSETDLEIVSAACLAQ